MNAKHRITVNLSEEEYAALSNLAERLHASMAWLGRRALAEMVEKYQGTGQLPLLLEAPLSGKER